MLVNIGVSNRHVHLTEEDFIILFGDTSCLEKKSDLVQTGEFACNNLVTLKTEKSVLEKVRMIGPFRKYTQVEVSVTDSYKLGITCPIRDSGDLEGASEIEIIGPKGSIVRKSAIIANRHIHVPLNNEYGLSDGDVVRVKVSGEKGGIMDNVRVKSKDGYVLEFHIDTDDANAHLLKTGDTAIILKDDEISEK